MVKERVTFQARNSTRDGTGQLSNTWTNVYTVGANIRRVAYSKTDSRHREISLERLELKIPYSAMSIALTTKNSVLVYNKRYDIDEVDRNTTWRREVIIYATERNQEG